MEKPYEKYFDDAVQKIQEGMSALAAKTDELTQKGKIKFEIMSLKRDIDKNFTELGKVVYSLLTNEAKSTIAEDDSVKSIQGKLDGLNEKLSAKKSEYESVSPQNNESKSTSKEESDTNFV